GNLQWDAHRDIDENHTRMAAQVDRPIAGLLSDLKRRGLLDSTLVVWGGEFGRSPEAQEGRGRDHHNLGFSMWLAGGGIKGDQARLSYLHLGREERLTQVHGKVIERIV